MSGKDKSKYRDTESVAHGPEPTWNSGGTAGLLDEERRHASFDVEKMTNFLDGGLKETLRRRWIAESTEELDDHGGKSTRFDLERDGKAGGIAANFEHFMQVHKKYLDKFYVPKGREMMYMGMGQTMAGYPGFGLFLATLAGQCSADQIGWWLPKAYTMQITGSYAQTELGHGSNVRGLETTAHYDAKTQEFVLNTPTLTSMKWWPSSMATSTHCVLYAQLIINGKEHGLHVFFLQLRDENLMPLPGIEVGDLGTKAGENEVDIGYLRLKDVRIPRRHMMEKRQHVEPDGTYVKHDLGGGEGNEKAAYLTMMTARVALVAGASVFLSKGATIAVRYNAVRRQGFVDTAKGQTYRAAENKIIDYKMNLYVLMRELSLAFAIRFTSNWLTDRMDELQANPDDLGSDLPEIHASAAGLKGYCCNAAAKGLEELRKSCGGAGYLMGSGIAGLEADYKWRATAEGETNVMLLQTARYLMKACDDAVAGRPLAGLTQCLEVLRDPALLAASRPPRATSSAELLSLDRLLAWFRFRTVSQVQLTRRALEARIKAGESFDQAWSALTLRAVYTGQSHVLFFMLTKFVEVIRGCEDQKCRAALERVCALFALSDMVDGRQWIGLMDIEEFALVEEAVSQVCSALRPDAVALVDAWDYTDKALGSTIGNKDGDVYERQYLAAAASPTNNDIVPEFFAAVKPYLDLEFLALRNKPCDMCEPDDTECYPPPQGPQGGGTSKL